ncbi:MAG: Flagellin N-methylase [candidate division WS2 bacterium ADurb.Bin280]|uniref:Flagellin N-methylase n=1 Tax=candidate division WS2 bacterium ADurb.Bin280 TaxID=1852829 RepID=A0A1V5SD69_9BACT|nr:MAG: Flagellin N-methylase [candidate division WS2 bacterium ADurb.Bin280]
MILSNPTGDKRMPFTKEEQGEFLRRVAEIQDGSGKSFVLAVYELLDRLEREAISESDPCFACHRGCGLCCSQLVSCTQIEWREIRDYLLSLDQQTRYWIQRHLADFAGVWSRYIAKHPNIVQTPSDYARVLRHWVGKPCPFLGDEGECIIYPVRPIECRTCYSTQLCTAPVGSEGVVIYPFAFQKIASTVLIDRQIQGQGGRPPVLCSPLLAWLEISPI